LRPSSFLLGNDPGLDSNFCQGGTPRIFSKGRVSLYTRTTIEESNWQGTSAIACSMLEGRTVSENVGAAYYGIREGE
jgi:hypothetical protein